MEPCGFEDQADMMEAVLVILWGRKALVLHEHELRQRRGALDPGDMVYLRCVRLGAPQQCRQSVFVARSVSQSGLCRFCMVLVARVAASTQHDWAHGCA